MDKTFPFEGRKLEARRVSTVAEIPGSAYVHARALCMHLLGTSGVAGFPLTSEHIRLIGTLLHVDLMK